MGTVYVIQEADAKHHGNVKVGFTLGAVEARVKALQTGNARELKILARFDGDLDVELLLHKRLEHLRLTPSGRDGGREWFRWAPEIEVLVNEGIEAWLAHPRTESSGQLMSRERSPAAVCPKCAGGGYVCQLCGAPESPACATRHPDDIDLEPCEMCA